jgi:hypothetical protein
MNYEVITNTAKKTKMIVNKTKMITTLVTLLAIALTGLISFSLFQQKEYNLSSLLTIAAYSSMVLGVYLLTRKKAAMQS